MKDFFYEMIVKSANASKLFKNFAFELGVPASKNAARVS